MFRQVLQRDDVYNAIINNAGLRGELMLPDPSVVSPEQIRSLYNDLINNLEHSICDFINIYP